MCHGVFRTGVSIIFDKAPIVLPTSLRYISFLDVGEKLRVACNGTRDQDFAIVLFTKATSTLPHDLFERRRAKKTMIDVVVMLLYIIIIIFIIY